MADAAPKHDVFQAIADPTRRKLLQLLSDQEMPVTVISGHFPMSRTAVSKHLRILSDAGLVKEQKVGRETRYSLQAEPLLELKRWLAYYERFWENKLNVLKHLVENEASDNGSPEGLSVIEGRAKDKSD
ncbi:metalloregulator ArsR/SmtB family transcription factor [Paenibacillus sp. LMG 31456]|uniref:Metalloregulator ArsR/SmtB family transcription factor n=1 Tax=Paenibacillus foliorum TaxID=2654974 RepID=A0A972GQV7_9BACL|nr:metalloregulator ArsR/SmtB family transcription factor [Paenibacillus foliorum]NOU94520.1 metalloregulator ArsR/SmtB family transcription factor [Paenibacillus foliorum]